MPPIHQHLDLPPSEEKARFVRAMFGRIAGRYDLMNAIMTLGRDRRWRRRVVALAAPPPEGRLLDIGAGTGGIALAARARFPRLDVVAADFTPEMMAVGRRSPGGHRMSWCAADALTLPFAAARFDAVVSGYLVRNVTAPDRLFAEQFRVLKPGGRLVCLDTTPPRGPLAPLIRFHFKRIIPLMGQWVGGDRGAYTYLPESTRTFLAPEALAASLVRAGFVQVRWQTFMFGTMALHIAVKPVASGEA
ncbi:MAG: ubiquinone/menaquinone biosynthesis methyltransferase [Desulfobacterales bacterium]|nr:ubiquinone/menaquinone biosynthesis methyltransferase [Desulfobacteraceae bacterium]MDD3991074.1 ubiquinone/menaquinone biosynthesis methyltransferase [Desulfobacteraceae bacterium]MDY0311752.1 ubiquinone/menaquinone biosynthesis methyltransferase [Desulfobacterales bacterium]